MMAEVENHLNDRARRELGAVLQSFPPGERGHPKDVFLQIIVAFLQFRPNGIGISRRGHVTGWGEDGVLVNGGIEIGAEAVGSVPEFLVEFVEKCLLF